MTPSDETALDMGVGQHLIRRVRLAVPPSAREALPLLERQSPVAGLF